MDRTSDLVRSGDATAGCSRLTTWVQAPRLAVVEGSSAPTGATSESDEPVATGIETGPPPRTSSRVNPAAEEAALDALRRGKTADALKLLMGAYSGAITAFAIRILRNRESAKDVHQLVFLEAFQGFQRFEGRSTLWRWLCGIAYHRCLDELRRGRRQSVADDFDVWDELAAPPDPTMDPSQAARRRALEKCLGKLSDSLRMQVMMRCYFGMSFAEIGEAVGDPHGTVQVRVSRILPRLRKCLLGEGAVR